MDEPVVAYVVAFCEIGIQQFVKEYTSIISLVSYTAHSCWAHAPDALSVEVLILVILSYLLGDFHRFGTFLCLKSILVEIDKWAQKARGEERLRFHDCLSLFT